MRPGSLNLAKLVILRRLLLLVALVLAAYFYRAANALPESQLHRLEDAVQAVDVAATRWGELARALRYNPPDGGVALSAVHSALREAGGELRTAASGLQLNAPAQHALDVLRARIDQLLTGIDELQHAYPPLGRAAARWPQAVDNLRHSLGAVGQRHMQIELQALIEAGWRFLRSPQSGGAALAELRAAAARRDDPAYAALVDKPAWPALLSLADEIARHGLQVRQLLPRAGTAAIQQSIVDSKAQLRRLNGQYRKHSNLFSDLLYLLCAALGGYALFSYLHWRRTASGLKQRLREYSHLLSEAESRLRQMADAMPASISYIDRHERYIETNATADAWHGLGSGAMRGRSMCECLSATAYGESKPHIDAALAGRETSFTIDNPYPDGAVRVVVEHYVPQIDAHGEVSGFYSMAFDVSAMHRTLRNLQRAIDDLPACVALIDSKLRIVMHNATGARWSGREPGTTVDLHVSDVWQPSAYRSYESFAQRALAGEEVEFDIPPQSEDPTQPGRSLHAHFVPRRDASGKPRGYLSFITDVTGARRASQLLERRKQMLERAEALSNVGSWRWGADDDEYSVSPETCRILDLPLAERHTQADVAALCHPDDLPRVRSAALDCLNSGCSQTLEVRLLSEDESRYLFVHFEAERSCDAAGHERTTAISGLIRDITENKHAARIEARLYDITEQVPGGIYQLHLGRDGGPQLPYLSRGIEHLLGYPVEELQQHPDLLFDAVHPDDAARFSAGTERCSRELAPFREEVRMQRKDGSPCWIEAVGAPMRQADGGALFTGYMQDITERKQLEAELELAKQRLQEAIESMPGSFMLFDADDRLVFWNRAQEEMFKPEGLNYCRGMPFEELVRYGVSSHQRGYSDFADDAARERFVAARISEHRMTNSSHEIRLADGRWIWVRESATREGGVVGIRTDITTQKCAEEELREHRDNLQQLVDARSADLLRAKEEAERANRMKSEFLANMSHELRTPMHAILSFANMGDKRAAQTEHDKLTHYFRRIGESGDRLLALLNDLLDLSKLEAKRMVLDYAEENFQTLVRTVLDEFSALLSRRGIEVRYHSELRDEQLHCDGVRILQVVRNLLSNAVKFSPEGGVIDLLLKDCAEGVNGGEDANRRSLLFSVRDRGPGIPHGELEAVFDEFVQSSQTRTGAGGTGLGLAICRKIMHLHGGSIGAASRDGGGAVFTFCLPRSDLQPKQPGPPPCAAGGECAAPECPLHHSA